MASGRDERIGRMTSMAKIRTPEEEEEHLPPADEEEEEAGDTDEPMGPPKPSGVEEPKESVPFLSSSSLIERPDPRTKAAQPLTGVTEWDCPRNGVHVVEIHYTADPNKRDPAWKREAQRGMPPRGWAREFEITWDL